MRAARGAAIGLVAALAAIACKGEPPAPRPEVTPVIPKDVEPPGACRNVNLEGDCHFTTYFEKKSMSDRLGERIFSVSISARLDEWTFDAALPDLSMDPKRLEEARAYYREHSPAHCKAFLVRPPCAPSSHVELDVDPPPFARVNGEQGEGEAR